MTPLLKYFRRRDNRVSVDYVLLRDPSVQVTASRPYVIISRPVRVVDALRWEHMVQHAAELTDLGFTVDEIVELQHIREDLQELLRRG